MMKQCILGLLLLCHVISVKSRPSLCTRCEVEEIVRLRRYFTSLPASDMTLREFINNLLSRLSSMPELGLLYQDLRRAVQNYDDCLRACEVPFVKRTSGLDRVITYMKKDWRNSLTPDDEFCLFC